MNQTLQRATRSIELSIVVPVYNGAPTLGRLVQRMHALFSAIPFEIVLVNDGSQDDSEAVCAALVDDFPETVTFVHLSRNFGEHNAVLAGLNHASGNYIAVLDDDGQNPPEEVLRMLAELKANNYDAVYGRYRVKHHGWFRNIGSLFADQMANLMLKKPRGLYLSSFKVMNRFLRDEIIKYRGPFPYVDGLIYRSTRHVGQIDVEHRPREHGRSNYTFAKLVRVWMNMFLNFSILPLRAVAWTGLFFALSSLVALAIIWIKTFQTEANSQAGFPIVLCCVFFFGGLNLLVVGMLGEYLGRLCLDQTGTPQFVVRYLKRADRPPQSAAISSSKRIESACPSDAARTPPYGIPSATVCEAEVVEDLFAANRAGRGEGASSRARASRSRGIG